MSNDVTEIAIVSALLVGMLLFAYLFLPYSPEYILVTGVIMFIMFAFGLYLSRKMR